jgi:hypothetical protein
VQPQKNSRFYGQANGNFPKKHLLISNLKLNQREDLLSEKVYKINWTKIGRWKYLLVPGISRVFLEGKTENGNFFLSHSVEQAGHDSTTKP